MKSHIEHSFRDALAQLPPEAQAEAKKAFRQFLIDARHPGLQFKKVTGKGGIEYWSVRIGLHYRALGYMDKGDIYWFWIGTHSDYDKLLA